MTSEQIHAATLAARNALLALTDDNTKAPEAKKHVGVLLDNVTLLLCNVLLTQQRTAVALERLTFSHAQPAPRDGFINDVD